MDAKNLRKAIERDEFVVYYQPIVDVINKGIVGMEALLRWHSPDMGKVYPDSFIPFAEHTGLIIPIGEWVLNAACARCRIWQQEGHVNLKLAVNISPVQLQHKSFVPMVEKTLQDTGFDPAHLELEVTEGVVFRDLDYIADTLNRLRAMGIAISIDDFGTRYSSLEYLNRLTVNALKIDKSFIRNIDINPNSKAIISATVAMARSLNLEVTAEGVERQEQLEFLKHQKCHYFQGYLFSPPVPAGKFESYLMNGGN